MADIILIVSGIIILISMIVYMLKNAYKARVSRPVMIELSPMNKSISASTINLDPYVDVVLKQLIKDSDINNENNKQ